MDYPTAWRLVRQTKPADHDPRCSFVQTNGAILCDCHVLDELEAVHAHGSARDVLDWMAWMEHVQYVHSLCDTTTTAMAVFECFKRSASAERGRYVQP